MRSLIQLVVEFSAGARLWTAIAAFACALVWLSGFLPTQEGDGAALRRGLRWAGWLAVLFTALFVFEWLIFLSGVSGGF